MNNYYITVGCENKSEIREESIERATKENTFGREQSIKVSLQEEKMAGLELWYESLLAV